MTDYTVSEVHDAIMQEFGDWSELAWELEYPSSRQLVLPLRGETIGFQKVDFQDGEEGDYSIDTFLVIRVGSQLFRKTGSYRSHEGTYWGGEFEEVEQRPKVIQVWEPKR